MNGAFTFFCKELFNTQVAENAHCIFCKVITAEPLLKVEIRLRITPAFTKV